MRPQSACPLSSPNYRGFAFASPSLRGCLQCSSSDPFFFGTRPALGSLRFWRRKNTRGAAVGRSETHGTEGPYGGARGAATAPRAGAYAGSLGSPQLALAFHPSTPTHRRHRVSEAATGRRHPLLGAGVPPASSLPLDVGPHAGAQPRPHPVHHRGSPAPSPVCPWREPEAS